VESGLPLVELLRPRIERDSLRSLILY